MLLRIRVTNHQQCGLTQRIVWLEGIGRVDTGGKTAAN